MCGVAGIYDPKMHPTKEELRPMVHIMEHRGPDSEGTMLKGPVAFGMRRLSIIDLDTGDQPISNSDQSVTVICNGEIYNYIELKQELLVKGYVFKTKADTEVLVHLFSEYGHEMLDRLNGMFAFAIWDENKQTLFIARDRMGIKPLYYTQTGDRFLFASELKSLLTQSDAERVLNPNAISDYLRLGYIPQEATPYKDIYKLLPGHYLKINAEHVQNVQWWDLKKIHSEKEKTQPDFDHRTVQSFDESIKLRMRSDVPVASFLSGGLDSSLISATASKMSPINFHTYNVKFDDAVFDESPFADLVAKQNETDHHQLKVSTSDILDQLPLLLWHMDEPNADSAIIPNYLVSKYAAENVKVCLSGLGGDELFGGYSRYIDKPLGPYRKLLARLPVLAKLLLPLVKIINPKYANRIYPFTGKQNQWRTYLNQIQLFDTETLEKMGLQETGDAEDLIRKLWDEYPKDDSIGRRQFIDQHTYLPDQILALTDRMSMAVSLEVRVPFLDHRLLMQAAQIPGINKQSASGDFKMWLKKHLGERVPQEISNRKKWGFSSPLENWISNPSLEKIIAQLPEYLSIVLNPKFVSKLVANKQDPRYHNMMWRLLVLAVWLRVADLNKLPDQTIDKIFE